MSDRFVLPSITNTEFYKYVPFNAKYAAHCILGPDGELKNSDNVTFYTHECAKLSWRMYKEEKLKELEKMRRKQPSGNWEEVADYITNFTEDVCIKTARFTQYVNKNTDIK